MADKIDKQIEKLSDQEQQWVKTIFQKLKSGNTKHLDIKKIRGRDDIFRVRKGDVRVIYRRAEDSIFILAVERRNEDTYKNF